MSSLALLLHNRWSPAIVAALGERGARVVELEAKVGAGRESVVRALNTLRVLGLVERNPGYGHPLRPEYVLTGAGRKVAPACAELLELLDDPALERVVLRKWSLPVLASLNGGRRYSELRDLLPGATSRALALALKDLVAAGLVEREVGDDFPPTTLYRAAPASDGLRAAARSLATKLP